MILEIQNGVAERIRLATSGMKFKRKSYSGEETIVNISVYTQELPEVSDESLHPSVVVKATEGDFGETASLPIIAIITIYDPDEKLRGYENAVSVMTKICEEFRKKPLVSNKYRSDGPVSWMIPEEDCHPYHYAAVQIMFEVPNILEENELVEGMI